KALLRAISGNHIGAGARLISQPSPPGAHVLSGRLGQSSSRRTPSSNLPTRLPSWPLPGVFGRSLSAHVLEGERFRQRWGVVDFGGKRAGGGTFGCSACDVCFIRSAQFSARTPEFDEAEAHSAASPRSPPTVAARTRIVSVGASCTRASELSLRSRFGDDLLVEPSHGVDSERSEIEIDRLYPELAHGAQVVDDLGVAAGEQEPFIVVGLRGRRGSVAMDPKGERDACRIAADVGGQLA